MDNTTTNVQGEPVNEFIYTPEVEPKKRKSISYKSELEKTLPPTPTEGIIAEGLIDHGDE